MERLTDIEVIAGQVHPIPKLELQNPSGLEKIVSRLQEIEDILGDTYDLDRLRELVEADKAGQCVLHPLKAENEVYVVITRLVKCIDTGKAYESTKQAERETGVYHSHISKCCSGKAKTAGGMRWEYV